ncbi:MAG: cation:proton antiporter [Pirellulaceae bacterium]
MEITLWFVIVGGLLISMAVVGSLVKRLPLTTAILYLAVGVVLGPYGFNLIRLDPVDDSAFVERLAEIAVIVSLFTAGLKLRIPLTDRRRWWVPIRLAFVSMWLTVGLVAVVGVFGIGLPWGAAILLGAVLAPTDPVLASDVQLENPFDRDRLRFGLTGEAGLNDGTAFPMIMLGLGLMGLHELGEWTWRWWAVDLVWAMGGGLLIGWLLGHLVGSLVIYLRREHKEALGLEDFLALGLIALSYGVAILLQAYGFLAVFAAGLALRRIEFENAGGLGDEAVATSTEQAPDAARPELVPASMVHGVLTFNEQVERIGEAAVIVLLGGMLSLHSLALDLFWFVPLLLLVIRPLSTWLGLLGAEATPLQKGLIGWFGIRGVGSIYYLMHAIEHGLSEDLARQLTALTFLTITISIIVHGISVTPMMSLYRRRLTQRTALRR